MASFIAFVGEVRRHGGAQGNPLHDVFTAHNKMCAAHGIYNEAIARCSAWRMQPYHRTLKLGKYGLVQPRHCL